MTVTIADQAREALRLAEADPGRSAALASAVAERARAVHDVEATAIAERALGLAALHTDDLDTAMRHLRAAIALSRRARSPRLAAEARMTLAYVLNGRGWPRQALREINAAVVELDGVERARAEAQRGAILQLLGRLDEALISFRESLPVLRRFGDRLWEQRVLSNRGVVYGYRNEFTRQQRPHWAALARFVLLSSRLGGSEQPRVAVPQLARAADALTVTGWSGAALEARLLAGQLAIDRGWQSEGSRILEQASAARRRGPALLRSRAWHAEALLRLAKGNTRGAGAAARVGLRVLDEHRATLGATDLRAYASGHRSELAALGLRIAMASGRASRVLAWAEQGRARHLLSRPVLPPDDPELADALARLRVTVREIYELRHEGHRSTRLSARQAALERETRDYCRRQPGGSTGNTVGKVSVADLSAALGDAALVEFVQLEEMLHAVTVADGRARLIHLGPMDQIRDLVNLVPFALHRLARHSASEASCAAAVSMLRHAAARLDAALVAPLAGEVNGRPLVVIPTGLLQSLPWSILPSCTQRPVAVAPSAVLWLEAS